mgnify:CR=1 FL=1
MKIFINFIIISLLSSQNFIYDDEDWIVVSNPGYINSMSIMYDEVLFTSKKGVYTYNQSNKSLSYMSGFIRGFSDSVFKIIHYDVYRDHIWFLTDKKLFFKPKISSIWREIEFYELDILDASYIKNIGSSSDFIFIKLDNDFITLNPYTGQIVTYEEHEIDYYLFNDMIIDWSSTRYDGSINRTDLKNFISYNDYTFISNDYIEYRGMFIEISNIIEDNNKNLWVGTASGELFKCNLYTNTFKKMPNVPILSSVNLSYYDDYGEWWFSTNDLIDYHNENFLLNRDIFLLHWKEEVNDWSYIKTAFDYNLKSSDITSLYRYQNNIYVGTVKGLYIYNLILERWIEYENTITDYVFDVKRKKDYIYIATNRGLKVMLDSKNIIIDFDFASIFNYHVIMDLEFVNNILYLSSDHGLFKYDFDSDEVIQISDIVYKKITSDLVENLYVSKKNKIFKFNNSEKKIIRKLKNIKDFAYCNDFLWINNSKYVSVVNLNTNLVEEYTDVDGLLGRKIYSLDCDDEWVWFSTDNGLVLYNWAKYHNVE